MAWATSCSLAVSGGPAPSRASVVGVGAAEVATGVAVRAAGVEVVAGDVAPSPPEYATAPARRSASEAMNHLRGLASMAAPVRQCAMRAAGLV
jgi:hypothetical protein